MLKELVTINVITVLVMLNEILATQLTIAMSILIQCRGGIHNLNVVLSTARGVVS